MPVQPEMAAADKIVRRFMDEIGEHVDTVQVFVTRKRDDGSSATSYLTDGTGNWFARYGQVKLWLDLEEEKECRKAWKDEEE